MANPPSAAFLQEVDAYEPQNDIDALSKQNMITKKEIIKLNRNENPFGTPNSVLQNLKNLTNLHWYPDPLSTTLCNKIAKIENISANNVVISAGADELIDLIIRAYTEPKDKVLTIDPTFEMYKFYSRINRATFESYQAQVNCGKTFASNIIIEKEFLEQAKAAKIIFLARPNNPDGRFDSVIFIKTLLANVNLVVIDEAYIEYADKPSVVSQLNNYSNLIILRTFSKAYGLSGLRIGYGLMPKNIRKTILKIKHPYNVNVIAQKLARVALEDPIIPQQISEIKQTRNDFLEKLIKLQKRYPNFWIFQTQGPFILLHFQTKKLRDQLAQFLQKKGILVRIYSNKMLKKSLRISIGTKKDMLIVYEKMRVFFEEKYNNES
ncbi:MAG: histidinol-phosphate transaminase [Asgard group archaeon]|nr:histidinol-phosphate transaminase [Asgard group archaeon]